jgi:tetratricopeptide (TPR) repeat protein
VALAAAVLLLAVGGGVAWVLRQQRRQGADAAAGQAMAEARLLLGQARAAAPNNAGQLRETSEAAVRARDVAHTGEASEDVQRQAVDLAEAVAAEEGQAVRDRRLLTALLEVRGPSQGPKFRKNDRGLMQELAEPSVDEQFTTAFRSWSLDVDATPTAQAVQRLKTRPAAVVAEVAAALDEWAGERRRQRTTEASWRRLADLAGALDEAPTSRRRQLRELLARDGLARERALGLLGMALRPVPVPFDGGAGPDRDRLRQLARRVDVSAEPSLGVLMLARALREAGDEAAAAQLLRDAVQVRQQEVVLYHALGQLLASREDWSGAVACYTAVQALRPGLGEPLADAQVNAGQVVEGLKLYDQLVKDQGDNPYLHFRRAYALHSQQRFQEAEAAYCTSVSLKPDNPFVHNGLGATLARQGRHAEAEAQYREALRIKPDFSWAHNNLGLALHDQGKPTEAEAEHREALRLQPDYFEAYNNLGWALLDQGRSQEAEAACREALRLKPDLPEAHSNLGRALLDQGRPQEAEAACRAALRLRPETAWAHYNLGWALLDQGRSQEAEAPCREAVRLKPQWHAAHYNLGRTLYNQGRLEEAEASYRDAVCLKPDFAWAHHNLALVLHDQGRLGEAEAQYREALRFKPEDYVAHNNLGSTLQGQGRPGEAEAAHREALRLKPDWAQAHCNLGLALQAQGRFAEALPSLRRGHELGSKLRDWRYPSALWVRRCEKFVELDPRLPAVLKGDVRPANPTEGLQLAELCQLPTKRLYVAATRLHAAAFAAEPKLADDLARQVRYNAARSATLAAAGRGNDADKLDARERGRLRGQALAWLRSDLALWQHRIENGKPQERAAALRVLRRWQRDPDLASVRDDKAMATLLAEERDAWQRLWADVAGLIGKADKSG